MIRYQNVLVTSTRSMCSELGVVDKDNIVNADVVLPTCKVPQNLWFSVKAELLI